MVNGVTASLEAGHDASVGDHQVLVAAAGADGEASCVVCVERADGFYPYVELSDGLGMFFAVGSRRGGEVGLASLGGADALLVLCKVALGGLITGRAILGSIGVGESWPGGEVAGFDGGEPGGFDWESCGSVEVADEGTKAGEVVGVEGSRGFRSRGKY